MLASSQVLPSEGPCVHLHLIGDVNLIKMCPLYDFKISLLDNYCFFLVINKQSLERPFETMQIFSSNSLTSHVVSILILVQTSLYCDGYKMVIFLPTPLLSSYQFALFPKEKPALSLYLLIFHMDCDLLSMVMFMFKLPRFFWWDSFHAGSHIILICLYLSIYFLTFWLLLYFPCPRSTITYSSEKLWFCLAQDGI